MPRKRIVEYSLSGGEAPELQAQIERDLAWYNGTRYAHLTCYLLVGRDSEQARSHLKAIIQTFRERKDSQKSDPNFKIQLPGRLGESLIELILGLDCRLPRIGLLPHFSDREGFANLADDILATLAVLRKHIVDFRFSIALESTLESFPALSRELRRLLEDPEGRAALDKFPVIEVPFTASFNAPAQLAGAIATLWTEWPQLNESSNSSRGGYIKHFYGLKELWYLAQITRQPSSDDDAAKLRSSYGLDEAALARLAAFDRVFLHEFVNMGRYNQWRHRSNSVVLEFDLDSIADTYECQSPVFVDNKWILERETLQPERATRAEEKGHQD